MEHYLPWIILLSHMGVLLFLDFFVFHKKNEVPETSRALYESLFFIANGIFYTGVIYWLYANNYVGSELPQSTSDSVMDYITGYLIELSLSVDNLFVIAIIFKSYKIPLRYQHRLLFLGILGAMVFRAIMISLGIVLVHKLEGITIIFGLFLLYTAFNMLRKEELDEDDTGESRIAKLFNISKVMDGGKFITSVDGKRVFTPLFGALITIELTDLLFALDSIPAIFAITTDPYLVFSSNVFAILGLRSLYFFLANMLEKFHYLKYSVFAILIFVAIKLMTAMWFHIPSWFSLLFIAVSLGSGVWISILRIRHPQKHDHIDSD